MNRRKVLSLVLVIAIGCSLCFGVLQPIFAQNEYLFTITFESLGKSTSDKYSAIIFGLEISEILHLFVCFEEGGIFVTFLIPISITIPTTITPNIKPIIRETMSMLHPTSKKVYTIT